MSKHSRSKTVWRVILAIVSVLVIVALATVAVIYRPTWIHADSPVTQRSSVSRTVSPRQLETYCPARMTIADTDAYGDSEYQASNGNIMSSARYASFGSVFRSSVGLLGADEATSSLVLNKDDAGSDDDIFMASGTVDDGAQLQNTRLLSASDGTGAASSVMSWATEGDLKGVSAASCVAPALKQSLMVSGTKTGMTQQLVVANPSAKATSVNIKVWGSDKSGALALSTGSTLTVGAGKESVLNLAAAASGQDALYVTVSSVDTPVAAVVRTIAMDGLVAKGSDYAVPNTVAAKTLAIDGLTEGDAVNLYVYPSRQADVTVSWTDDQGLKKTNQQTLESNRVSVIDLGSVPKSATGLTISASEPVSVAAKITNDGDDDQADFALVNASVPMSVSAMAVPDHATAQVGITNISGDERTATLTSYNSVGDTVDQREIALHSGASTTVDLADINDGDVARRKLCRSGPINGVEHPYQPKRRIGCETGRSVDYRRNGSEGSPRAGTGQPEHDRRALITYPNRGRSLRDGVHTVPPGATPLRRGWRIAGPYGFAHAIAKAYGTARRAAECHVPRGKTASPSAQWPPMVPGRMAEHPRPQTVPVPPVRAMHR